MKIRVKRIQGITSLDNFDHPDAEYTTVVEGKGKKKGCLDSVGGDGEYLVCKNDFINHESGMRIRVLTTNYRFADVMVSGLRWGGIKQIRLYKGRTRPVYIGDRPYYKIEISSVADPINRRLLTLRIETVED